MKEEPSKTGKKITLQEMAECQRVAGAHFSFSLTLACPLECKHCLVNAGPSQQASTLPVAMAARFADQMNELRDRGVQAVSFTGGEALLAGQQLGLLSEAALKAGLLTGIVTSSFWAINDEKAISMVQSFPSIAIWDLSVDRFHLEAVSLDRIRNAYNAIKQAGRVANIRFCSCPIDDGVDSALFDELCSFVDEEDIFIAKLRHTGRGEQLLREIKTSEHLWMKPCFTQGPIIRPDGSVGPCCVTLAESRNHPFQLGNAFKRSLSDIHEDFLCHPLLQLIRTIGFGELYSWMRDSKIDKFFPKPTSDDICDVCPTIMTNPQIYENLAERAAKPENDLRIAVLTSRIFGQHNMLYRAIREPMNQIVPGYVEAKKYADAIT